MKSRKNWKLLDNLAKRTKQPAPARKDCTHNAWDGKNVLAVRHGCENVGFDPIAIGEHALLMATGAEVARLTRECEQVVVAALRAIDSRKTVVGISAFEKPGNNHFFGQPF